MNARPDLTAYDMRLARTVLTGGATAVRAALTLFERHEPETLDESLALVCESLAELDGSARITVLKAWDEYRHLEGMARE